MTKANELFSTSQAGSSDSKRRIFLVRTLRRTTDVRPQGTRAKGESVKTEQKIHRASTLGAFSSLCEPVHFYHTPIAVDDSRLQWMTQDCNGCDPEQKRFRCRESTNTVETKRLYCTAKRYYHQRQRQRQQCHHLSHITAAGRRTQPDLESSTRAPRAEEAGTGKITPWPDDPPKPVTLDDLTDRAQRATTVCYMENGVEKAPSPKGYAGMEPAKSATKNTST